MRISFLFLTQYGTDVMRFWHHPLTTFDASSVACAFDASSVACRCEQCRVHPLGVDGGRAATIIWTWMQFDLI